MEYRDLPTWKRMETHGEIAAGQAEAWFHKEGLIWRHYGVEHEPENGRFAPDYDVPGLGLVEAMSMGQGVLRVKREKLYGLRAYPDVKLWVYDPDRRRGGIVELARLYVLMFEERYTTGAFDGGLRPWYGFKRDDLDARWDQALGFIQSEWKRS